MNEVELRASWSVSFRMGGGVELADPVPGTVRGGSSTAVAQDDKVIVLQVAVGS